MISTLTKKHSFDPVFDSQKVYRRILAAMSNPGAVVDIKESGDKLFGDHPALLAVAMTLLDNEVSFSVSGEDSLAANIASLTLSREADIRSADFAFVTDPALLPEAIASAKCGTLTDPDESATLVIHDEAARDCALTLSGPGIDGALDVNATEAMKNAIALRDSQHYEYPEGIDLIFITRDGELTAIPRFVKVVG